MLQPQTSSALYGPREPCHAPARILAVVMAALGTNLPNLLGQSMSALPGNSDIDLFCYGQGVIDLDTEVSDGTFDFGVAEQELHGS